MNTRNNPPVFVSTGRHWGSPGADMTSLGETETLIMPAYVLLSASATEQSRRPGLRVEFAVVLEVGLQPTDLIRGASP
jgi:hypothetical protein